MFRLKTLGSLTPLTYYASGFLQYHYTNCGIFLPKYFKVDSFSFYSKAYFTYFIPLLDLYPSFCQFYLQNIPGILSLLIIPTIILVQDSIIYCLDCYNNLTVDLPTSALAPPHPQSVLNTAPTRILLKCSQIIFLCSNHYNKLSSHTE